MPPGLLPYLRLPAQRHKQSHVPPPALLPGQQASTEAGARGARRKLGKADGAACVRLSRKPGVSHTILPSPVSLPVSRGLGQCIRAG